MKLKLKFIMSASAASVLALTTVAEDKSNPNADGSRNSRDRNSEVRGDRLNGAAKVSDIIGMPVRSNEGKDLGKVEDLAVDVESGRIVHLILSIDGRDRLTAVPPGALRRDVAAKALQLDADKEKLEGGPRFDMSEWAKTSDTKHLSKVYRRYDQERAFNYVREGDTASEGKRNTKDTVSDRKTEQSWDKDRVSSKNYSMIPASRLAHLQRASKLVGMSVINKQDDKLGKVENILVDVPSGRLVAIIVSSGGFLGMGDELSAVPPSALRFTTSREALQLDATKETLSRAPHFKPDQWPDYSQPGNADAMYRAYNVEPYFSTNVTAGADNTARNVRDRKDKTQTPLDQGNNKADVEITAQIRKEIVAGKNMSVNAKNVKIITKNGQVTLRGPVNTAEEKRLIGEIAADIAAPDKVDNQLEVKFTTSSNN